MTEAEAVVRQAIEALDAGSRDTFAEVVAEDAVNHTPFGTRRGRDAYVESAFAGYETYPDLSYRMNDIVADSGIAALRLTLTGTQEGVYRDVVDPTGREVEIMMLQMSRVVDGKISESWTVFDRLDTLEQLATVTDWQIRAQYLTVLNRVLRHNLRNELQTIKSHANLIANGAMETQEYAETIVEAATRLNKIGEKARQLHHHAVGRPLNVECVSPAEMVSDVTTAISEEQTAAEIKLSVADPPAEIQTDPLLLETALSELVENAVVHNGTNSPNVTVSVGAAATSDWIEIRIVDDGPGISEAELQAIKDETETSLTHASGIGLWAVKWSVERLGGDLSFHTGVTGEGTAVSVTLPDLGVDG